MCTSVGANLLFGYSFLLTIFFSSFLSANVITFLLFYAVGDRVCLTTSSLCSLFSFNSFALFIFCCSPLLALFKFCYVTLFGICSLELFGFCSFDSFLLVCVYTLSLGSLIGLKLLISLLSFYMVVIPPFLNSLCFFASARVVHCTLYLGGSLLSTSSDILSIDVLICILLDGLYF